MGKVSVGTGMASDPNKSDYRLDPGLRALVYRGEIIELSPRAFSVLRYLFLYRDRVVSKEELLEALWPRGSTEQALRQEIYALRKDLRKHRLEGCIVTVSQLGYRFEQVLEQPTRRTGLNRTEALPEPSRRALAGAAYFASKGDTAGYKRSLLWFETVCKAAPTSFDAHEGAMQNLVRLSLRSAIPIDGALVQARLHANAMSRISPDSPSTMFWNACLLGLLERKPEEGVALLRSLRANIGDDGNIAHALGLIAMFRGHLQEAEVELSQALDIKPGCLEVHWAYGMLQVFRKRFEAAKDQFAFLHNLDNTNGHVAAWLGSTSILLGNHTAAIDLLSTLEPTPFVQSALCIAFAKSGKTTDAQNILQRLLLDREHSFVSGQLLAKCYAALGEPDKAMTMLMLAASEPTAACARFEPFYSPLISNPIFQQTFLDS